MLDDGEAHTRVHEKIRHRSSESLVGGLGSVVAIALARVGVADSSWSTSMWWSPRT